MKKFSNELKKWRRRVALTQEEAALKLGVRLDRLRKWEQDKCEPEALVVGTLTKKFSRNGGRK